MKESDYFNSEEFQKRIQKSIERETWDKGLPRIYMDKDKNIVRHWKDGRIEIIKKAE